MTDPQENLMDISTTLDNANNAAADFIRAWNAPAPRAGLSPLAAQKLRSVGERIGELSAATADHSDKARSMARAAGLLADATRR